jgi:hypothetical protein
MDAKLSTGEIIDDPANRTQICQVDARAESFEAFRFCSG